jgi:hypothetical protein
VQATLPHLSPTVRAMIELQLATCCRPGELCILRPGDVDRSGEVWEYVPQERKTQHHEHDRVICIGPKGQDIAVDLDDCYLWRTHFGETAETTSPGNSQGVPEPTPLALLAVFICALCISRPNRTVN